MHELTHHQRLLVRNWQKKNQRLNAVALNSLVGLSTWGTILALGNFRKELV